MSSARRADRLAVDVRRLDDLEQGLIVRFACFARVAGRLAPLQQRRVLLFVDVVVAHQLLHLRFHGGDGIDRGLQRNRPAAQVLGLFVERRNGGFRLR